MPTPLASRFVHLDIRVDAEDWLDWGVANGIAPGVLYFVTYKPDLLHQFDPKSKERAYPCPRTWEFTSNIVKHRNGLDPATERALFRGAVGEAAAVEFSAFLNVWRGHPGERQRPNGGRLYDREASDHIAAHHDASTSAGRHNKRLLPKAALAALNATMNETRTQHYAQSLPWDDKGSRLLTVANG